jgi:hypothetical protein
VTTWSGRVPLTWGCGPGTSRLSRGDPNHRQPEAHEEASAAEGSVVPSSLHRWHHGYEAWMCKVPSDATRKLGVVSHVAGRVFLGGGGPITGLEQYQTALATVDRSRACCCANTLQLSHLGLDVASRGR